MATNFPEHPHGPCRRGKVKRRCAHAQLNSNEPLS